MEAQRLVAQTPLDHFFETDKRAAADEENVGGVDREEFLVRMFASALWWNVRDSSFEDLQQRLLHTFAGDVASDRRILVFAANLVDFVDIDNALLSAFD